MAIAQPIASACLSGKADNSLTAPAIASFNGLFSSVSWRLDAERLLLTSVCSLTDRAACALATLLQTSCWETCSRAAIFSSLLMREPFELAKETDASPGRPVQRPAS